MKLTMPARAQLILIVILAAVMLLMAGCAAAMPGSGQGPAAAALPPPVTPEAGKLTVADVRSRPAPMEFANGAAYLTILNGLADPVRLVGVTGSIAKSVEMHETINDNGVMKMEPRAEGFEIPAGGSVELKPGGKHIMLMGLVQGLAVGDVYSLTLQFDNGESIDIDVPVMDMEGMPSMQGMSDMPDMTMDHAGAMPEQAEGEHDMAAGSHDEHMASGEHAEHMAGMTGTLSAEVQALFAALPIDAVHAVDEGLAAGKIDPMAAETIAELRMQVGAVEWPEELQPQIEKLQAAAEQLEAALKAGDVAAAAPLAEEVHGILHGMEMMTPAGE
ncbi:MAG: copper chaperone PCu(A)C [Anaerolineales bacterium]|nr:copper chaperone PCu(A)C [Anaerolineales bacterium]